MTGLGDPLVGRNQSLRHFGWVATAKLVDRTGSTDGLSIYPVAGAVDANLIGEFPTDGDRRRIRVIERVWIRKKRV